MIYFPKSRAMFLHIPKCGGNWVEGVIQAAGIKHVHVDDRHAHLTNIVTAIEQGYPLVDGIQRTVEKVFTFVRHPVTWYQSYWRYHTGAQISYIAADHLTSHSTTDSFNTRPLAKCGNPNFEQFGENCLQQLPGYVTNLFYKYTKDIWFVGKQENLRHDLCYALDCLGEEYDRNVIMAHPAKNIGVGPKPAWSEDLQQRIMAAESVAMERYGYE